MTVRRTTSITSAAQAALVEWADRWQEAAQAAVEADIAEEEALRGPHEPGPEFSRALEAEEAHEDAQLAQEEAWLALLGLPIQDMPAAFAAYAGARGRSEQAWVEAFACLDGMLSSAAGHPGWALTAGPPEVRAAWFRAAKAARAEIVASAVPMRRAGEEDYARLLGELGEARQELCDACDALEGPAPEGREGRHPAWELKRARAEAEAASDAEAEAAQALAAWVADNLGPPPGRLN